MPYLDLFLSVFSEPFERSKFLRFGRELKKFTCSVLPLLTGQVQTTFIILHFGVKLCKDFGPGEGKRGTLPPAMFLSGNNNSLKDFTRRFLFVQGCRSLLSIGGDNLQFYPNFALFSTLGR